LFMCVGATLALTRVRAHLQARGDRKGRPYKTRSSNKASARLATPIDQRSLTFVWNTPPRVPLLFGRSKRCFCEALGEFGCSSCFWEWANSVDFLFFPLTRQLPSLSEFSHARLDLPKIAMNLPPCQGQYLLSRSTHWPRRGGVSHHQQS